MKKTVLVIGILLGAVMMLTACNNDGAEVVEVGDTVSVEYTGRLSNGDVFDSSEGGAPLTFPAGVGAMIPGFDAAVVGMSLDEEKTVTIPAAEAYGAAGVPDPMNPGEYIIPPDEDITFDIKVVAIEKRDADADIILD
jgi:FKBP-type peptidyl-prolyl cis-trans isomerase